ncbi:uncharacterized protein LOC124536800 [Vanessa cardui]|uniref:uncharacterized protein LOC124536800 n=1 Tax=Vanessa cardui TaxID=171605 RepID=UPI001F12EDE8|nr:uncharacterized protein LOC124536800 [Vanessa cardui]
MEEKKIVWPSDLTRRFFELRFQNDWLFKKKKQPWREFHRILLENGFPEEITVNHIRKKWSYTYDSYRIAKKTKNKSWKYYRMFEKHLGKSQVLDKYEAWNDEWRLKLIICISEAKEVKLDYHNMWRTVESALRSQDLPLECCIQDLKGLWHYIRMTFNRKHRLVLRRTAGRDDWPLYASMLEYYSKYEPDYLERLQNMSPGRLASAERRATRTPRGQLSQEDAVDEFQWSKDITESFIQIRLQNDWVFRDRKWAWNNLRAIMIEEYGFPKTLTGREICRKWAATYAEYQKAKATNNKSWVYYTLFELYFGEGSLSLNPLVGWQEEWVLNLISARTDLDHLFRLATKNSDDSWREVEKRLRTIGIPLDHSLLDLPEIWKHLLKTFRWKQKFANKGILNEQWPYFEAIAKYTEINEKHVIKEQKDNHYEEVALDDDIEDDMKLFDLKQRLSLVKPKLEAIETNLCRSCSNEDGCVNIYNQTDDDGLDLAHKLKIIGGIEVDQSDTLPSQICLNCLKELENAYKFRRKCQEADRELRNNSNKIKIEISADVNDHQLGNDGDDHESQDFDVDLHYGHLADRAATKSKQMIKGEKKVIKRKKIRKLRYDYWKVCEVCGKHTRNLVSHLDMHSIDKGYSCEICEKKFKFKSGLIVHRAVHNPTPKKTCEVCGKSFHILAQYRRHFAYHANERKFECETCGKRFNSLDILRVHNRSHTDERPFSCPECGKTFRTAGCVSRHKRIVHRNVKLLKK